MIVQRSQRAGLAEKPSKDWKSHTGPPSPGGEGRGEGELNCSSGRKPAPICILAPDFWILNSSSSDQIKPILVNQTSPDLDSPTKSNQTHRYHLSSILVFLYRKRRIKVSQAESKLIKHFQKKYFMSCYPPFSILLGFGTLRKSAPSADKPCVLCGQSLQTLLYRRRIAMSL
jgi:hypothetical protein